MTRFAFSIAAGLALFSSVVCADIKTTYLPERPAATPAPAVAKAKKEVKAVFLILFDDRETMPDTLNYFFDSPAVKKLFEQHFVTCVRDRRRQDVAKYDAPEHAWNRARFVVLTPEGDAIHQGRFLRNDEAGQQATEVAVQAWLEVRPRFETAKVPAAFPPRR